MFKMNRARLWRDWVKRM